MRPRLVMLFTVCLLFMISPVWADTPSEIGLAVTHEGLVEAAFSGCGNETISASRSDLEQEVGYLVNQRRKELGLPPFKLETRLFNSARYHAFDMGQDNYFDHNSYDRNGSSLVQVCETFTRIARYYDFISAAENIAAGQATPTEVMTAWLNSSGHRENIDSTTVWEMGVGYYAGSGDKAPYWVQNFGRRAEVYPVVINYEEATTSSPNVSLYVYGRETWSEIRFRNDADSWGNWQPFTSEIIPWGLNNTAGEHNVSIQLRQGSTESSVSSDTIVLTTGSLPTSTPSPTLTPSPTPLPDLVITSMNFALEDNRTCGSSTPLGLRVNFINQGHTSAGVFVIRVNNSTQTTVNGLAAGATGSVWLSGVGSSGETIAMIDANQQVTEGNETNNTITQILPLPTPIPTCTPTSRPTVDSSSTPTNTPTPTSTTVTRPTVDPAGTATSTPRPTVDPGSTPTATPSGFISGVIQLQGRNDYSNVEIWGSETSCTDHHNGTILASTNRTGQFQVSSQWGYSCLYVVKTGYMLGQNSRTDGNLGSITLVAGDFNGDNKIDIFDVAYVSLRYEGSDLSADLTLDGQVNIFDIALVSGNYQKQGPLTAWK